MKNESLEKIELLNMLIGGKSFKDCLRERGIFGSYTDLTPDLFDMEAYMLTNIFFADSIEPVEEGDRRKVRRHFLQELRGK